MESIIQQDKSHCYICELSECGDHLDKHHIFGGALRNKSEKYGLTVYLHHNKCHIFGAESAHQNGNIRAKLQQLAQLKAMQVYGWSEADFIKEFYKSYL